MDRRQFLRLGTAAGLTVSLHGATAAAFTGPPSENLYLFVHAVGGWDPRLLCDPATTRACREVETVADIRYAPLQMTPASTGLPSEAVAELLPSRAFFEAHGPQLLCVNGLDMGTLEHQRGTASLWTGRADGDAPAIGALIAAARKSAFICGPSTPRGDLVERMRLVHDSDSAAARPFEDLRDPEPVLSARPDDIVAAVQARQLENLPHPALCDLETFLHQGELVLAAFDAGLAVAAQLELGGFDTHASHDRQQLRQFGKLFRGVDDILRRAARRGLADRLVLVVASELGRTAAYESSQPFAGKEHARRTSLMMLGPDILGGRSLDPPPKIGPADLHRALRQHAQLGSVPEHPLPGPVTGTLAAALLSG